MNNQTCTQPIAGMDCAQQNLEGRAWCLACIKHYRPPDGPRFLYHGPTQPCTLGGRELHCGDALKIFAMGTIFDTRLEHNGDWYLVGMSPPAADYWSGCIGQT